MEISKTKGVGYHTSRPANIDLLTGRRFDGSSVGNILAATLPCPLDCRGMYARIYGQEVTVEVGSDRVSGTQAEVAEHLRQTAAFGRPWQGETIPWSDRDRERLLDAASRIEALNLEFEDEDRRPTIQRPPHNGYRDGVLR